MNIIDLLNDAYAFNGDLLHRKAVDEIERLRGQSKMNWDAFQKAATEIERLREDKAELVEALIDMRNHINERDWDEDVSNEAKATFAKATGGE